MNILKLILTQRWSSGLQHQKRLHSGRGGKIKSNVYTFLDGIQKCVDIPDRREAQKALEDYNAEFFYSHLSNSQIVLHNSHYVLQEVVKSYELMIKTKAYKRNLGVIFALVDEKE